MLCDDCLGTNGTFTLTPPTGGRSGYFAGEHGSYGLG
jgi:hypothetical protein